MECAKCTAYIPAALMANFCPECGHSLRTQGTKEPPQVGRVVSSAPAGSLKIAINQSSRATTIPTRAPPTKKPNIEATVRYHDPPPKRKSAPPASTPHVGGTAGAGTQTPYCKFYLSPGGCAHGVTCRFRHDQGITAPQAPTPIPVVPEPVGKRKRPVPCKFYFTAAGCQSGVLCRFSHASGDATDPPAKRGARGNGAAAPVACQRHQKARHPSDINPDTGCCYDHALCDARHLQAEDLPSYDQACPRYDPQASRDKVLCARHGKLRKSMYIDPRTGGCFDSSPCMT
uniref:C3H1-type domain-containing protein n=1 Tax=Eutreptiella gymnastica TaxID=73025 RepID=A0A7S1HYP7_9EUGL|mmetsp:Transcript_115195/g.200515  ORF Transcript_115195/g.200515 Transcript_115195/m.200515 type:complete len:287 (+) Transcript_115195:23-883(+)